MKTVLWFLFGSQQIASSRLQGYLIHDALIASGYHSRIVYVPRGLYSLDLNGLGIGFGIGNLSNTISIIQKLRGKNTDSLIKWLQKKGSRVVYVNCDLEPDNLSWLNADRLFVTSQALRNYHIDKGAADVRIVDEPYEYACDPKPKRRTSRPLKVVWFGNRVNWQYLLPWKDLIERCFQDDVQLTTVSDHPDATYRWSASTQERLLNESDFTLLPSSDKQENQVKSPNRLVQSLAVGSPVITSPIPSYVDLLSDIKRVSGYESGILVHSLKDLHFAISKMLQAEFRLNAGAFGYEYVLSRYSSGLVCRRWIEELELGCPVVQGGLRSSFGQCDLLVKLQMGEVFAASKKCLPWRVQRMLD